MTTGRSVLLLALTACLAFSGCTDDGPDGGPEPSGPESGRVEGQVLDEVGLPVQGATVTLLLGDQDATTGEDGSFRMEEVAPGPVVLVASKPGHISQTLRDELGEGGRVHVVFRLTQAPALRPHVVPLSFDGILECALPSGVACGPLVEEDPARHRFEVEPGLRGILYELEWSSPAEGIATRLRLEAAAASGLECGGSIDASTGSSVLRLQLDAGFPVAGGHQCARVWPSADPVAQQAYTLHVALFYHMEVPEGYSSIG